MPSTLEVIYDGQRRGRHMVYIEPHSRWGERPYGLDPRQDDFTFDGPTHIGRRLRVVVSDPTLRRLVRQQNTRAAFRGRSTGRHQRLQRWPR